MVEFDTALLFVFTAEIDCGTEAVTRVARALCSALGAVSAVGGKHVGDASEIRFFCL